MTHQHDEQSPADVAAFWEDFYSGEKQRWSGNPNALLVPEVESLAPGTALDLGCGEGGDAIWLAGKGWRVTGADVSSAGLALAAEHAAAAGVGDAITWERHDLDATFPAGEFDLVTACYLQSPVPLGREQVLRRATAAVAPGGTLVVVSHAGWPTWMTEPPAGHRMDHRFSPAAETLERLELESGAWVVERAEDIGRPSTSPDGVDGTRPDSVVRVRALG
jgi:SAM-dependent methyltransferase